MGNVSVSLPCANGREGMATRLCMTNGRGWDPVINFTNCMKSKRKDCIIDYLCYELFLCFYSPQNKKPLLDILYY